MSERSSFSEGLFPSPLSPFRGLRRIGGQAMGIVIDFTGIGPGRADELERLRERHDNLNALLAEVDEYNAIPSQETVQPPIELPPAPTDC